MKTVVLDVRHPNEAMADFVRVWKTEKGEKAARITFATHLLKSSSDIRTVQELLDHRDVKTTMIYTHVLHRGPAGVRSPLNGM